MWRAEAADDELRRTAFDFRFDDSAWEQIPVPGHWQRTEAFAESDGPLIYRTRFDWEPGPTGARTWVTLDGVAYQGDVWLDGAYLGDSEGYFIPHSYEITELARLGNEHALAIEVACHPQRANRPKRAFMGALQDPKVVGPNRNPGGIWQPVRIERTGPVRIERMTVLCTEADASRATVEVRLVIDADRSRSVRIRTTVPGRLERERTHPVATGRNEVRFSFGVEEPDLWWPWSLGPQGFTNVRVEAFVDDVRSDEREVRTGLRQVAMDDMVLSVNGERLFAKGVLLTPPTAHLGEAAPERFRRDIALAKDAGLDLVRVDAHVSRHELYDAADEAGMLIWQDLPMRGSFVRTARRQAMRHAHEMVAALGHHPSIALWCGHDAPFSSAPTTRRSLRSVRDTAKAVLPSWNRTVLDGWLRSALQAADPSRPALANSGTLPHLPLLDATDTQVGWASGIDITKLAARLPRMVRWVTGLSAASVPPDSGFLHPDDWPNLDWEELETQFGFEPDLFNAEVPPLAYGSFDDWFQATQDLQARELRAQIETLRRLKYQPTGGFTIVRLADSDQPAISTSLVDHSGNRKPAYDAVTEACRAVIVVVDALPVVVHPGDMFDLAVHVVSDLRSAIDLATVASVVTQPHHTYTVAWEGAVEADSCVFVGRVSVSVADRPGPLEIDITLLAGDHRARTTTRATIQRLG